MAKVWSATFQGTPFEVYQSRTLKDNFTYLITSEKQAIAIDVGDGPALFEEIEALDLSLDAILITHHHKDHISGAGYLKQKTDCQIIGPKHVVLDFLDQDVADGEEYSIGPFSFEVIATPGHSQDHVVYFFRECLNLFSGDALFLSGCGRMLDTSAEIYFASLQKIKNLPQKTLVFCGHDYLKQNLEFAFAAKPDNPHWKAAPYVTFRTLEEEIPLNPFLMAETPEEFLSLREEKNLFDAERGR